MEPQTPNPNKNFNPLQLYSNLKCFRYRYTLWTFVAPSAVENVILKCFKFSQRLSIQCFWYEFEDAFFTEFAVSEVCFKAFSLSYKTYWIMRMPSLHVQVFL